MSKDTIWFKARRYGWGWGPAVTWQGWFTYGAFAALAVLGAVVVPPGQAPGAFVAWMAVLTTALVGICAAKGERPRWRWGGR